MQRTRLLLKVLPLSVSKKAHRRGQKKVADDGYNFKRKRSRSGEDAAKQPESSKMKMRPHIRSEQICHVTEDLEETRKEISFLEQSRIKSRNINNDEKALRITKELEPLRLKRRRLEKELQILQRKESKSLKDKKRRVKNEQQQHKQTRYKGRLDVLINKLEAKKSEGVLKQADAIKSGFLGQEAHNAPQGGRKSGISSEQGEGEPKESSKAAVSPELGRSKPDVSQLGESNDGFLELEKGNAASSENAGEKTGSTQEGRSETGGCSTDSHSFLV